MQPYVVEFMIQTKSNMMLLMAFFFFSFSIVISFS